MADKYETSRQISDVVTVINNKIENDGYSLELVLDRDKLLTYLKEVRLDAVTDEGQTELNKILTTYK